MGIVNCNQDICAISADQRVAVVSEIIDLAALVAGQNSRWNCEISDRRYVKNIIDATSAIVGGFAGGAAGIAIGNHLCSRVGTLIGGFTGGIIGTVGAAALSKWLTEYFFDLPPTVALEKAYSYLDLKARCTNTDINSAFKKLALEYHPDKGGSTEDFHKLQYAVAIIKQARGQEV
ncbi:unnamed protein product [Didymodactylos carnosus]|uniref:J domain-containing protein n=1 Tax=Didymodactylos carnosus TaxID=1234261 RepID=A0A816C122_9BILA|nr:unnamed protein product [Didymodactylos carnosus]CAF1617405.1 unnamed protein product [Didymodactylos carnosus]CAF4327474.1 unnamed protein product [Didymodactylos carnosus]CAF4505122.1 unnamed protein product [Didymodactylos carnosus]